MLTKEFPRPAGDSYRRIESPILVLYRDRFIDARHARLPVRRLVTQSRPIRDGDGVVLAAYQNYVRKIRTPPLKGLRFNRFVTDSYKNTNAAGAPACDFLLHDGRACDAIEAAFVHDGPAIKKLGVIQGLTHLTPKELRELRAFLYSL